MHQQQADALCPRQLLRPDLLEGAGGGDAAAGEEGTPAVACRVASELGPRAEPSAVGETDPGAAALWRGFARYPSAACGDAAGGGTCGGGLAGGVSERAENCRHLEDLAENGVYRQVPTIHCDTRCFCPARVLLTPR